MSELTGPRKDHPTHRCPCPATRDICTIAHREWLEIPAKNHVHYSATTNAIAFAAERFFSGMFRGGMHGRAVQYVEWSRACDGPIPTFRKVAMKRLLPLLLVSACSDPSSEFTATQTVLGETQVLTLSHSLHAISNPSFPATTLRADLNIGGAEAPFVQIADVRSEPAGGFSVLDRSEMQVMRFSADGTLLARLARPGDGPGEFRGFRAFLPTQDGYVVWQTRSNTVFTMLDRSGRALATSTGVPHGDWMVLGFRDPARIYDSRQSGPEDVTRRLRRFDSSTFVHALSEPEDRNKAVYESLPVNLIRYSHDLKVVDTLMTLRGGKSLRGPAQNPLVVPAFVWPLFSPRSLWTTGEGWWAVAHGDSARVTILDHQGRTRGVVQWPTEEIPVSPADRHAYARFGLEAEMKVSPDFARQVQSASRREVQHQMEKYLSANAYQISERAAQVTALYGGSRCLFMAGYRSTDGMDGTARTWVAVDVSTMKLAGILRLSNSGERVRDFSDAAVYTTLMDDDGTWRVRRYSFQVCKS